MEYKFAEGGTAGILWSKDRTQKFPACPYPNGSEEATQWETGLDDALEYLRSDY